MAQPATLERLPQWTDGAPVLLLADGGTWQRGTVVGGSSGEQQLSVRREDGKIVAANAADVVAANPATLEHADDLATRCVKRNMPAEMGPLRFEPAHR